MDQNKVFVALDVGTRHIGVAVSDPLGITANPIDIIKCNGDEFETVKEILDTHNSNVLIIGLPKTLRGEVGTQAEKVLQFTEELRQHLSGVEIVLWDERFTSVIAHKGFLKAGVKSRRERKIKDAAEAVLILQSYLSYLRRKERKDS
jgi:putative Holliday junction resolvase